MPLRKIGLVLALLLTAVPHAASASDTLRAVIDRLGGKDCPESALTCVDLAVPIDRAKPGSNERITVRFAINFASKRSKGILFYAVGGLFDRNPRTVSYACKVIEQMRDRDPAIEAELATIESEGWGRCLPPAGMARDENAGRAPVEAADAA